MDHFAPTSRQIQHITGCNFVLYSKINLYNDIMQILKPEYGYKCLLLYDLPNGKIGHFVCLFLRNKKIIEYFDSYGYLPLHLKKQKRYLDILLYNSKFDIEYNDKEIQTNNTYVCGCYCIFRMILSEHNDKDFNKLFLNIDKNNRDIVVGQLCHNIFFI